MNLVPFFVSLSFSSPQGEVAAKAQADTDMAALARELEAARGALEESSGMNELLTEENRRVGEANRGLQEQVDAYRHLEARALSVLND